MAREALEDNKGINPVLLDVRDLSTVTDYYLIVSGTSSPHIKALADGVQVTLKKDKIRCYRKSGTPDSSWMVLDYVDMVVHVFSEETRDFYGLEQLWSDAAVVAE